MNITETASSQFFPLQTDRFYDDSLLRHVVTTEIEFLLKIKNTDLDDVLYIDL